MNFSGYFLKACRQFNDSSTTSRTWESYFTATGLSPLQLKLLGINAHINGDLWKALRVSYPADKIKEIGKTVFILHQSLLQIYTELYRDAIAESRKIMNLNLLSIGLSEKYGKLLLSKWRKRQIKLATDFYFKPIRFEKKRVSTENKKSRIDNLIIRRL